MRFNNKYWTFSIPGTDSIVAAPWTGEGLLILNSTAGWIWQNRERPDLSVAYAEHFGISVEQAESDISQTFAVWRKAEPFSRISIGIQGTTFEIEFQTEALAAELQPRLAHLEIDPPPSVHHTFVMQERPDGTQVYKDGVLLASEHLLTGARAVLLQELTRLAVPDRSFLAVLHAGACGTNEAAVILAGESYAGKSTLCAALMERGLLCLSDDSVCLTPDFLIAGMPFALSLRGGSWPLFPHLSGQRFIPSNLACCSPAVPARALVFVNYQPDASMALLEPISTLDALLQLQRAGFWVERTQPSIESFLNWLGQIPRYRLIYSSLSSAEANLIPLLMRK